jgi:hypothetical protein
MRVADAVAVFAVLAGFQVEFGFSFHV